MAAKGVVEASQPSATVQADSRYSQSLDPGNYLMCVRPYCINVVVVQSKVTTVHVRQIFGPTRFIVFDSASRTPREPAVFDVGGG